MAIIFGICDPDADRRAQVQRLLPESLSGLPHLVRQQVSVPDLDIFWEASASTPLSHASDEAFSGHRFAWVVGDFDAPYSLVSDAAPRLLASTAKNQNEVGRISGQNGYYVAVLFERSRRLVLGGDVLGMFPLYYWAKGDVFLFGTSPEFFKCHPLFLAEPCLYGITSVLLLSHISSGFSLYKGVRRSSPGKYVEWSAGHDVREQEANSLQMSDAGFDTPYQEYRDRVAACLDEFHAQLAALPQVNISLSGGQDSRAIAAFLGKHILNKKAVCAVSIGEKKDTELSYALRVSSEMGWRHSFEDIDFENYVNHAYRQLKLESLQGPFSSFHIGMAIDILAKNSGPVISGYLGDAVIGDRHIYSAFSAKSGEFDFLQIFNMLRRYGFQKDDVIDLLLSHDAKGSIEHVIQCLKEQWSSVNGMAFQKAWYFSLTNRQRFHIGSLIWRLSLGAWHLLPYANQPLLNAVASMPLSYFCNRKIQADLIKSASPRLAQIPLDRNDWLPGYLVKPWRRRALDRIPGLWRVEQAFARKNERRYYYRIYDFNGKGWRLVRREAEKCRPVSGSFLNSKAVSKLLPVSEANVFFEDGIVEASKIKTLAGLLLWNGMNFVAKH